jgi:hypothetical protein
VIPAVDIFSRPDWQMSPGERAALEGLVSQLRPRLAIEIGTAEGGSLQRIAAHSAEVHAIDLTDELLTQVPSNVTFHRGDSRRVLPDLLGEVAAAGRTVDFVLVDGDHSSDGVRADLAALLESPAVQQTLILLHDAFNPDVRAGIESVSLGEHPRVEGFDLDFVPGRLGKLGPFEDQFLGGFGLVVVGDGTRERSVELGYWSLRPSPILFHDGHDALGRGAALVAATSAPTSGAARLPLDAEHVGREQLRRELEAIKSSASWRITAPLRWAKARVGGLRARRRR